MTFVILIIGFVLLIKGADFLVEGASSLAKRLRVSDMVVGLTVVAFGTSTPELFVNIFASIRGNTEIAIGNILGSNIFNILFILGLSAVLAPLKITKNTVWKEVPLSLLAAVMVFLLANDRLIDGASYSGLSRIDGLVLLAFFAIFINYTIAVARDQEEELETPAVMGMTKSVVNIVLGLGGLVLGGKWVVESAVKIAIQAGVSESLVGLTIVAAGTSLPELVTSAIAASKKKADIAVGNVVGSNIFNVFWILGVSAVIKPLPFLPKNNFDVAMAVFASLVLFMVMFAGRRHMMDRWKGILFILCYVVYILCLVMRG